MKRYLRTLQTGSHDGAMMGQCFRCGARYAFVDCGQKVKVNVPQDNWWLRPLLFQRPSLDQPFLFGFQHLSWLQISPSPPSWSIIFLHCLSLRPRISYLETCVRVSSYMQAFTALCLWHSLLLKKPVLVEKKITGVDIPLLMSIVSGHMFSGICPLAHMQLTGN